MALAARIRLVPAVGTKNPVKGRECSCSFASGASRLSVGYWAERSAFAEMRVTELSPEDPSIDAIETMS